MVRPGARNLITDVAGLTVGNAEDADLHSGVTVLLPDAPALAGVDVRGGAPGTRETDLLRPSATVERVDAIVLSGGSAFGLDAASGVTHWLAARGRGFELRGMRVPIVPAAILFDLANGGDKEWGAEPPYRLLGMRAADAAAADFALGSVGAGCGAMAGKVKGGLGSASLVAEDGLTVGALVAVNAVGEVGLAPVGTDAMPDLPPGSKIGGHTTIGIVATDAALDKAAACHLAAMAQAGLARVIRPVHTPLDGDTIFALATGGRALPEPKPLALARIGHLAAECMARAVLRAVAAATGEA